MAKSDAVKTRDNKYFGKVPQFYEQIDPLTEKKVDFDENVYLRQFLNIITLDSVSSKLNENINKAQKVYLAQTKKGTDSSMTIFFNQLSILYNEGYLNNYEKLKYLYKSFVISPGLNKFSLLYNKYLKEYNEILLNDKSCDNSAVIFNNLIMLGDTRSLEPAEEE